MSGFAISIASIWIGKRNASARFSYGWHRAEIIGALTSIIIIWGLIIWMVYEAFMRVMNPVKINGKIMLITACIGFFCNLVMIKALHS